MLEILENRRLMNAALNDGVLTINGTDGDDTIVVWQPQQSVMRVRINDDVTEFATGDVASIHLDAGAGNDRVILGRRSVNATLIGGEGDDVLSSGDGNDLVLGGAGDDYIFGRGGDDTLDGGAGADDIRGGRGIDTADYSTRTASLRIGIGVDPNDGESNEHDNVHLDIEVALGGSGHDRLLNYGTHSVTLYGGAGNDSLIGGAGRDVLIGGTGRDSFRGNWGDSDTADVFWANDGEADAIISGSLLDEFDTDLLDLVESA